MDDGQPAAFRSVPKTGVIYVTSEAVRHGFDPTAPAFGDSPEARAQAWCNLGQGQPETGVLPGAPPRVESIAFPDHDRDYAPVAGLGELREAIADLYNHLYRRGLPSQYSAENVCVAGGGRAALTRAAASMGRINLGHFLPDYTAYEELLEIFRNFTPIPILLAPETGYDFTVDQFEREVLGRGLGAVLLSNPCNPTGRLVAGDRMRGWLDVARRFDCALLLDEFYSHYVWNDDPSTLAYSAASAVTDVERDPVVIFDGLTKNWRYPGLRVAWAVGPKRVIEAMTSAGSFLDGGGSRPLQRAAVELLEPVRVAQESRAIKAAFRSKRDFLLERLMAMGIGFDHPVEGTFYAWGNLRGLPEPLDDGMALFEHALAQRVITVPGVFFDVNPGKRRHPRGLRFHGYSRFSFGPPLPVLEEACRRLELLIAQARAS